MKPLKVTPARNLARMNFHFLNVCFLRNIIYSRNHLLFLKLNKATVTTHFLNLKYLLEMFGKDPAPNVQKMTL